ncbi:MAG TPA: CcmD family protein [Calditrichia bacterium]|nr:CcmD family protein [Calditrichota bacterium]HQU74112.1 CcmD family protein [Calditrichia bacterium]HQV32079.1 CcmD family protein [Calditrichia bacterium]
MINLAKVLDAVAQADSAVAQMAQPEKVVGENIFVVMAVTLLIWFGILGYLFYVDMKLRKLNDRLAE